MSADDSNQNAEAPIMESQKSADSTKTRPRKFFEQIKSILKNSKPNTMIKKLSLALNQRQRRIAELEKRDAKSQTELSEMRLLVGELGETQNLLNKQIQALETQLTEAREQIAQQRPESREQQGIQEPSKPGRLSKQYSIEPLNIIPASTEQSTQTNPEQFQSLEASVESGVKGLLSSTGVSVAGSSNAATPETTPKVQTENVFSK